MNGEKIGSKDLFRKTKTKRDFLFSVYPCFKFNKAFKAGPTLAAVFHVRRGGGGGGKGGAGFKSVEKRWGEGR